VNELYDSKNVVLVCAAGNSKKDISDINCWPAGHDSVITVGAHNRNQVRWKDSNYGPKVDIYAPGEEIITLKRNNTFEKSVSGTSISAAFVSGVLGLVWSKNLKMSAKQVRNYLIKNARPTEYGLFLTC